MPVLPSGPIITPRQMYAAEQAVIAAGVSGFELMQRAGRGVADAIQGRYPPGALNVLCGPGGNGGDGFVAAARLAEHGWQVRLFLLSTPDALNGDPLRARDLWSGPIEPLPLALAASADVTLDALFGGGLSRPLSGVAAELVEHVNGPVVSVDVPSGLDGGSAHALGPCFEADLTVTFAALRPAHVLDPGRQLCGEVDVIDIGVPVTSETRFEPIQALDVEVAHQIQDLGELNAILRITAAENSNLIDTMRAAAKKRKSLLLLQNPQRILAWPDGQVVVAKSTLSS